MNLLQKKIINTLIENTGLTSYAISKKIKKSIPSVEYALLNLVDAGVVIAINDDKKTTYTAHSVFYNDKAMTEVGEEMIKVLKIIEKSGEAPTARGYLDILGIIIANMQIRNKQT